MDVFRLREQLVRDYSRYISSFINIRDSRIYSRIDEEMQGGLLWPEPLIQLNPAFETGGTIDNLVEEGLLHPECSRIFRLDKDDEPNGRTLTLHRHQADAIRSAHQGENYVLTTGTGSGKSLAYIVPIVDHVLRNGSSNGTQAIVVYPMNALANSQMLELKKFLFHGYETNQQPVTFERYTGQESEEERQRIITNPPDILLTNFVMLELILTRSRERQTLVNAAMGMRYLVLDELHSYRGRQGADVAMLVRRLRNVLSANTMQCVGTSATIATGGTSEQQKQGVASVASRLFGVTVKPDHVIGETLRRVTPEHSEDDNEFLETLSERLKTTQDGSASDYESFLNDPLSSWIESTFGVVSETESGRLIRPKPQSISGDYGATQRLSELTNVSIRDCKRALENALLDGYGSARNPQTAMPAFAFRVHQFISRGDTVYASLESKSDRYITVDGQQFVPDGTRERILLPLAFCRECGQEYYTVRLTTPEADGPRRVEPRELRDRESRERSRVGFLFFCNEAPWPTDPADVVERVPDDWLELHRDALRVNPNRRKYLPESIRLGGSGEETANGLAAHFVLAPFRFCLQCGVTYNVRASNDYGRLASLGTGGRSTATTICAISILRTLREDTGGELPEEARKLLSFTDNRQDASLQAGHFNDFVEIGLLRAALFKAIADSGPEGIRHQELPQRVFEALELPFESYARDAKVMFAAVDHTKQALRRVLGYRLYNDLRRGWRVTSPNLEQCGLLQIEYQSLDELCQHQEAWEKLHPVLATSEPETRARVAKVLLDYMRRELAIEVDYLQQETQEQIQHESNQHLKSPWAIDENETMERSTVVFPRPRENRERLSLRVFVSPRGGFGQFLRASTTFPDFRQGIKMDDAQQIISDLLQVLQLAGLVIVVAEGGQGRLPGYAVRASALIWKAGDGTTASHDPIRLPQLSEGGGKTNIFFVEFYRSVARALLGFEGREHTAQVPYEEREVREERFRKADLPILFCSPTMELGVDIAELNVVNMRNIPPTPANYAQRSGRAGRSGQPALIFTYCSIGSPHDQYFFKEPEQMVHGAVVPPRIELSNEDLVRSHVQAIWLAETNQDLQSSLKDLLDLDGDQPTLALLDHVRDSLASQSAKERAKSRVVDVLDGMQDDLEDSDWYWDGWIDEVVEQCDHRLDQACERWRGLYRAADQQQRVQNMVVLDPNRSHQDRTRARRLRAEAESQRNMLTESIGYRLSDFYSYRYFASEGFLPGYNFPRLPLSAYIPGRRGMGGRDEFLSRPRFLAIAEFGPRALLYHEGSRYIINKVLIPTRSTEEEAGLETTEAKLCGNCGYYHRVSVQGNADRCELCGENLGHAWGNLFRLQNVSTKRRDRINSDEEERIRQGYELRTAIRFADHGGTPTSRIASVTHEQQPILQLRYGSAASIWRINIGWRRRKNDDQFGFLLDTINGYWATRDDDPADPDDPMGNTKQRIVPFVEDRKNCLLLEPEEELSAEAMASLAAALKRGILLTFQLEDNELAVEPLPDDEHRRQLLFFEASEGGAGVLRQLAEDADQLREVARKALQVCHFDPDTGEDQRRSDRQREDCEAACYNCLLSYYNQRDHHLLDRHEIREMLQHLAGGEVEVSPVAVSRGVHLQQLLLLCESNLEREWLHFIDERQLRLPTKAQWPIQACHTRPDFLYEDERAAIYVDGPHHDYPERQVRDIQQTTAMQDAGYSVIRFSLHNDWEAVAGGRPDVFGEKV